MQLDLFTGEPIPPSDEKSEKQRRITKTTRLALVVQLSIARLDRLTDTMKLVSELCEQITGIAYPIDFDELHRTYQRKRQHETMRYVTAETREAGRLKGTPRVNSKSKKDATERTAEIRRCYFQENESQTELAQSTGLAPTTIRNIIHRKAGQR